MAAYPQAAVPRVELQFVPTSGTCSPPAMQTLLLDTQLCIREYLERPFSLSADIELRFLVGGL